MAVYNSSVGQTSACTCKGTTSSCHQSIYRSHPPTQRKTDEIRNRDGQPHRGLHPLLFSNSVHVGSVASHRLFRNRCCEMGPTVYRPYPFRRLESQSICRCHSSSCILLNGVELTSISFNWIQQHSTCRTAYLNIQHCMTHCSTFVEQELINKC